MTFYDWLSTVQGRDALFAAVLLVQAVTAWIALQTKRQSERNSTLLDGHLTAHRKPRVSRAAQQREHQVDASHDAPG